MVSKWNGNTQYHPTQILEYLLVEQRVKIFMRGLSIGKVKNVILIKRRFTRTLNKKSFVHKNLKKTSELKKTEVGRF